MADTSTLKKQTGLSRSANQIANLVSRFARLTVDLVLPPVCLSCQTPMRDRDNLCAGCWSNIDFITPPLCDRLGIPMPFGTNETMISAAAAARPPIYRKARAAARYSGTMRNLIHDFKFRDQHQARALFTRWLIGAGHELIAETDIIIPVPLNRFRLLERRFNQSAILAQSLAMTTDLPYQPTLLIRTRHTKSQVGLTNPQRRKNVSGAFAIDKARSPSLKDRRILLIDDVITTGATAEACTRTLLKAGAAHVNVLALALVTDANQMTT